jgi:hypothetical protein
MKSSPIKRKISSLLALPLFAVAIMSMTGCEKDYNYVAKPTTNNGGGGGTGGTTTVSFATDVQPIFTANCATASCHGGTIEPNLSAGNAYSSITGGGYINTGEPTSSDLYRRITLPSSDPAFMPEGGTALSGDKVAKILTWIQEGAQNN